MVHGAIRNDRKRPSSNIWIVHSSNRTDIKSSCALSDKSNTGATENPKRADESPTFPAPPQISTKSKYIRGEFLNAGRRKEGILGLLIILSLTNLPQDRMKRIAEVSVSTLSVRVQHLLNFLWNTGLNDSPFLIGGIGCINLFKPISRDVGEHHGATAARLTSSCATFLVSGSKSSCDAVKQSLASLNRTGRR